MSGNNARLGDNLDLIPDSSKLTLKSLKAKLPEFVIAVGIANVFYGAPRFSRDLDFAVVVDKDTKERLL